jgi:hypothetical protein
MKNLFKTKAVTIIKIGIGVTILIGFIYIMGSKCSNEYKNEPIIETSNECITIKDGWNTYNYKKVIIEDHEYYFRIWATRNGAGSDLVHNPNCSTCNNKENI